MKKQRRLMPLAKKERDALWLDDRVSRVFLREEFSDDKRIQQLLDHSEFRGRPHG